jgi:O-acetyl-ADP-ribose deacetylase (regulator of RNase III)
MTIKFISLNTEFINIAKANNLEAYEMEIQNYKPNPNKLTFYVSPANSFGTMDGGIDLYLDTCIFPDIEKPLRQKIAKLKIMSKFNRPYLPIGSSIIIYTNKNIAMVSSPTMLKPQEVSQTQNAYYATIATLYNIFINNKHDPETTDIILTSFCCGWGKMDPKTSFTQIQKGINDYKTYKPQHVMKNIIICEPNLWEQPKNYENTEFT